MADPKTRDEVVAISNRVADEWGIPRALLLACGIAESNLKWNARRPSSANQDASFWPDVSGGIHQQAVRYDPDYAGGSAYPGAAEVERILEKQYDVQRSSHVAAANLKAKLGLERSDPLTGATDDQMLRTLYRYNWPGGAGKPYSPAHEQNYRRGLAEAKTILGGSGVATVKLSEVLARGHSRAGDPYVWDGEVPGGFDCSGFVKWAYDGQLTSFTDAILGETERVEKPAPGDIVLYEYKDSSQPGVRFPHVGLFLSDTEVLDARFGQGVGVHPQLPRTQATRYYRRKPGVIVDTEGSAPGPTPPQADPRDARIAQLEAEVATLQTIRGYLTHDVWQALQAAVDELKRHAA